MTYAEMLEALPQGKVSLIKAVVDKSWGVDIDELVVAPIPNVAIVGKVPDFYHDNPDEEECLEEFKQYAAVIGEEEYVQFFFTLDDSREYFNERTAVVKRERVVRELEFAKKSLEKAEAKYKEVFKEEL